MLKGLKKGIACVLSLALLVPTTVAPVFATEGNSGVAAYAFEQEKSTDLVDVSSANPIEVNSSNISQLLNAGNIQTSGKYYLLTEDIVLNDWKTVEYFAGVLDGNGHTITLNNSQCFIHFLTAKGALQNIGFLGTVNKSEDHLASSGDACVVASCQGKVLNCYMNMTYGSGCNYASGLIGQIQGQGVASNCAIKVTGGNTKFYPLAQEAANASKIYNCYWDKDSRDDSGKWADYPGMRAVVDRADVYDCSRQEDNGAMLELLNKYKGDNAVEWVAGEGGFPVLKNESAVKKVTVSFTKADGTVVENVENDGLELKLQDVPANHNAGTFKLNNHEGKVAWLLSDFDYGKEYPDYKDYFAMSPSLYTGALGVNKAGEATIVAWEADTLDGYGCPTKDSVELARFKVTVSSGKVEEVRLLSDGEEIKDNSLTVKGSQWFSLQPQTREEGSTEWKNVPVSSVKFPESTEDTYAAVVTNTSAKYRAKKPGQFQIKVEGFGKEYTVNVTSEYVPVESIKPTAEGTIEVYPADYKGEASLKRLGTALETDVFNKNVVVSPANASYAYDWTMKSSDTAVVDYTYDNGGSTGVVPKKAGEATLTVTSADPQLGDKQVTGTATVKFVYAEEVAADEFKALMNKVSNEGSVTVEDKEILNDAKFIYDNMSEDNQVASAKSYVKLIKAENEIKAIENKAEMDKMKAELEEAKAELEKAKIEIAKDKTVAGVKLKSKSKKITVSWKATSKVDGYEVVYKSKSAKKYTSMNKTTSTKAVTKSLKKGTTYSFKVRTYTKIGNKTVYGKWTSVKSVKYKEL